jgi:hypothetical protein
MFVNCGSVRTKIIRDARYHTRDRRVPLFFAEQQVTTYLLKQLPFECLIEDGGEQGIEFSRRLRL